MNEVPAFIPVRFLRLIAVAAGSLLLCCSRDYNPFHDLTNARARVIEWNFGSAGRRDTVEIFSTATIRIAVAVRESVDSFSLMVPGNRFGDSCTMRGPLGDSAYCLAFSLWDTGRVNLTLTTFRKGDQPASEVFSLYARSPLKPRPVQGYQAALVRLTTDSVADRDAVYYWHFSDAIDIASAFPVLDTMIAGVLPTSGIGKFWVSDVRGRFASPPLQFSYSLADTSAPRISLLPGELTKRDTVFSGDTALALRVSIVDPGCGVVVGGNINGGSFDDIAGGTYTKIFHNLPAITPLKVTIGATDLSGNQSAQDYWIVYSSAIAAGKTMRLIIESPAAETTFTPVRQRVIVGSVTNDRCDSASVTVQCLLNGVIVGEVQRSFLGCGSIWGFPLSLDFDTSDILVRAHTLDGQSIGEMRRMIIYRSGITDAEPPVIAEVAIDGLRGNVVYTPKKNPAVRIIAFDEGSGLASVQINGRPLRDPVAPGIYLWNDSVTLDHAIGGNQVQVTAVDHSGNRASNIVIAYYNSLPKIVRKPDHAAELAAGIAYAETLLVLDADNDPLVVSATIAPPGLTFTDSVIRWTSTAADTGQKPVKLRACDAYQCSDFACTLAVYPTKVLPCSLSLTSKWGVLNQGTLTLANGVADTLGVCMNGGAVAGVNRYSVTISLDDKVTVRTIDSTSCFSVEIDPSRLASGSTLAITAAAMDGSKDSLRIAIRSTP